MKNKEEWYEIVELDKFVESTRVLVFDAFGRQDYDLSKLVMELHNLKEHEQLEINKILTQQECMTIVKNLIKKKNNHYVINHKIYTRIIENINERLVGNMLSNLTNRGLLESAYDSTLNDFVFWIPDINKK